MPPSPIYVSRLVRLALLAADGTPLGGLEDVVLVPNGDLQYVSEPIAREKIARLGLAKTTRAEETA